MTTPKTKTRQLSYGTNSQPPAIIPIKSGLFILLASLSCETKWTKFDLNSEAKLMLISNYLTFLKRCLKEFWYKLTFH